MIFHFINIINAKTFKDNEIQNITVTHLDKNYNTIETIIADKANILSNQWSMENVKIYNPLEIDKEYDEYKYNSSFNSEIIQGKPTCIIANTIKGKGLSIMENKANWHYWNPMNDDEIKKTREELS